MNTNFVPVWNDYFDLNILELIEKGLYNIKKRKDRV